MTLSKAEAAKVLGCDPKGISNLLQNYFYDLFGFDPQRVCPDKFTRRGWEAFEAFYTDTNLATQSQKTKARREWLIFEGWECDGKPITAGEHFADLVAAPQSEAPTPSALAVVADMPDTNGLAARAYALAARTPQMDLDSMSVGLASTRQLEDALQAQAALLAVEIRNTTAQLVMQRGLEGIAQGQALGQAALANLAAEATELRLARAEQGGK